MEFDNGKQLPMLKQNLRIPSHMRNAERFRKTSDMTSFRNNLNDTSSKDLLGIRGLTMTLDNSRSR